MKKTLFIYLLLLSASARSQFFYHLVNYATRSSNVSNVKNIQPVSTDSVYEAFGILLHLRTNKDIQFDRVGTTHVAGGQPFYRIYNEQANYWYDRVQWDTLANDCRDIYGYHMDNDSIVLIYREADNMSTIWIRKCDTMLHFSPRVALDSFQFGTRLASRVPFGIVSGTAPGTYYCSFYSISADAATWRLSVFKTTNYWNTYTEVGVAYSGSINYAEPGIVNLGNGRFMLMARNNVAGSLTPFESTDSCVTWTRRIASNLFWYGGGLPEIPYIYQPPNQRDSFTVIYECRDASVIHISKGNTVQNNFGLSTPTYTQPEVYAYHRGTGTNPSLGYPKMLRMENGKYLITFAKEYNSTRANLLYTRDDLVTDPNGVPAAPVIPTSSITSSGFRYDITVTDKDVENIRYWKMDLSTDPAFGSFVTAKYLASALPAAVIHNTQVTGKFVIFSTLTTATTYYCRVSACNNAGCSPYTTAIVTTL